MASVEPSYNSSSYNGQDYSRGTASASGDAPQYSQYGPYANTTQTQYMNGSMNNGYSATYPATSDGLLEGDQAGQPNFSNQASDQSPQNYYSQTQPPANYNNYYNYQQSSSQQVDPASIASSLNQMRLNDGAGQTSQPPPPDLYQMNARANAGPQSQQQQQPPYQQYPTQQQYYSSQPAYPPAPQSAYPPQQSAQPPSMDGQLANRQPASPSQKQFTPQQQPSRQQQQAPPQPQQPMNSTRYGQQRQRLNPDDMPSVVRI